MSMTTERRAAYWRSLERMRQAELRSLELQMTRPHKAPAETYQHWGTKREHVEYGLLALAVLALSGAVGVVLGMAMAVWQAIGGL